jgi:hypothetical protein
MIGMMQMGLNIVEYIVLGRVDKPDLIAPQEKLRVEDLVARQPVL